MTCKVESCCCGCSLKTGCFIIGLVQAVLSGIALALSIVTIVAITYTISVIVDKPDISKSDADVAIMAGKVMIVITSIQCVLVGISMFFGILLAYAANKEKAYLLKPWMVYTIINVVLLDIVFLIGCVTQFNSGDTIHGTQSLFTIIAVTALQSYFVVVVKSYYEVLTNGRTPFP